mmetsp:Transcript_64495/g.114648  ORF Transcript_64495/g.114648 Transcript_64495/m.114648 type:complete len:396 (+) Transcript_64495:67-1254(+)
MEADATRLQASAHNGSYSSLLVSTTRQAAAGGLLARCGEEQQTDVKDSTPCADCEQQACCNCVEQGHQTPVLVEQVEWSAECKQESTVTTQNEDGEQDLPDDSAPECMPNSSAPNLLALEGMSPAVDKVSSTQPSRDDEGSTQVTDLVPPSETSGGSDLGPRLPAAPLVLTAFSDPARHSNKATRCTPRTPFWSVTNAQILHARHGKSIHEDLDGELADRSCVCARRSSCLCQRDADGADTSIDVGEVLEEHITSIDLNTEEQRIDWRDYLCEVVASKRAVSLYQLYDVEADPPHYARPPPSVPQPDSISRAYAQMGRLPLPCIAPNGTGWTHVSGPAHRSLENSLSQEVTKDFAKELTRELTDLTKASKELSKEMTDRSNKSGQRSSNCSAYEY